MVSSENKSVTDEMEEFISDYEKIVKESSKDILKKEWVKNGDFFELLSMFDYNYKMLPSLKSLGSTTLNTNLSNAKLE